MTFFRNHSIVFLLSACLLAAGGAKANPYFLSPALQPFADELEVALERSYSYLLSQQREDGSFEGRYGGSAGVVALAGMAFLASGHTPGNDEYGRLINRCLDYVMAQQDEETGYILTRGRNDRGMYSHHLSTLFLASVSGMVDPERDIQVRHALSRAVRLILDSQAQRKRSEFDQGGWRYRPDYPNSDLSVSGWALMALRAARLNGVYVPDQNIQDAVGYILRLQSERGSFGYRSVGDNADGRLSMTGLAILCLSLTGHHESPEVRRAEEFLVQNLSNLPRERSRKFGVYYATQAAFQLGGETWERTADHVFRTYLRRQQNDGAWIDAAFRHTPVYGTAMTVLSLTVPYRQLPIYQRDETVDE